MTTTTEDGGRLNMFAKEPKMYIDEGHPLIMNELLNASMVASLMLGVIDWSVPTL